MKTNIHQQFADITSAKMHLFKSLINLFESGEKKEFERLKNFITS